MSNDPIDNAWKIHSALIDWTGKVDTKASFALTVEAAILAGVVTLSSSDRVFSHLSGWAVFWYVAGLLLLIGSVLAAVHVVRPRLRSKHLPGESARNYVYFGHLRLMTREQVEDRLENSPILPVLANQLLEMSKICWDKHKWVQKSMTLAPAGVLSLGIAAYIATH